MRPSLLLGGLHVNSLLMYAAAISFHTLWQRIVCSSKPQCRKCCLHRYDRIRETLCHELAHMVWGEHDNRFKQLNSQLLKECGQLDWTGRAGHALQAFEDPSTATWIDEDDVMAVTAQASGQTLRQLTHGQGVPSGPSGSPRRAVAMAASARLAALVNPGTSAFPEDVSETAHRAALVSSPPEQQQSSTPEAPLSDAVSEQEVAVNPAADIANLGHRDASTEQAEEAMRQLGSMDFTSEVQHMSSPEIAAAQQREPAQAGNDQRGSIRDSAADLVQQRNIPQAAEIHGTQIQNQDAVQHALVTQATSPANNQSPTSLAGTSSPAVHSLSSEQSTQADQETHTQAGSTSDTSGCEAGPNQTDSGDIIHTSLREPAQAAASMDADADDPAVQRYRKAEAAVAHLRAEAGAANQLAALETLLKILQVSLSVFACGSCCLSCVLYSSSSLGPAQLHKEVIVAGTSCLLHSRRPSIVHVAQNMIAACSDAVPSI